MAVKRTVDLGTVGFGLIADTRSLQASLTKLRQFGEQVNNLSRSTVKGSDVMYAKFSQIERILTTLQARTTATTQRMKETGVAAAEIDKVTKAYQRLQNTLTQGAGQIPRHEVARGVVGMSAILQRGNRLASSQEASKFAVAFRDLERAAILAVGPLSGVGARLAVLSTLFESTSAKMALTIAGATAVATAFSLLAVSGVKATMQMQQFEALLETSTGSAALVGKEYEYISGVANKFGVNIKGVTEQYSKFATAARLSNLPLEEQRKIFEGAVTAGTAMRLSSERMSLVFLALEQMVSKGTVSMEELRRQMGDLVPGSFAMAAKAMGVTEEQLSSMIRKGDVLAKDLLPKLADEWLKVFGPGAARSSTSLRAELDRLSTSTFEMLKAFDKSVKTSEAFTSIVRSTSSALSFLAKNMDNVIAVLGALAGAGGALLLLNVFSRLVALIPVIVGGIKALSAALIGLGAATAATGIGGLLLLLARITVVVAGAAAGFALLKNSIDPAITSANTWISQTDEWIKIQKQLGQSHAQTTKEMQAETTVRLKAINDQIEAVRKQMQIQKQSDKERWWIPSVFREGSAASKALKTELVTLTLLKQQLEKQLKAIGELPIEPPGSSGGGDKLEEFRKKAAAAAESVEKMFELLNVKREEMLAGDPEEFRHNKQLASDIVTIREHLEEMKWTQESINDLVDQYRDKWRQNREVEKELSRLKTLEEEMQRIEQSMGDSITRKENKLLRHLEAIAEAERKGVRTAEEAARLREQIRDQHYLIMLDKANVFARAMHSTFKSLESGITKSFVDMMLFGESTWRDMFKNILRMLAEFVTQVMIVQPILKSLFGALYTGRSGDIGTGLLEGILGGIGQGLVGGDLGRAPGSEYADGGYAVGTAFVPRDMLTKVHRGEKIIPAGATGGMSGNTYNISINVSGNGGSSDGGASPERAVELGRRMEFAIRKVIMQEQRPGGLLAT